MVKEHVGPVVLEPIEHVYIHRITGVKYSSVTKAIASIEPHFDADAVAEAITHQADNVKQERYIGLNKQDILDFWQMLNDEANIYGTRVHDILERYLKANKWYYPPDTEIGLFEQRVIEGYNKLNIDEGVCMYPERIMFSEYHKLAGMSDLIIDLPQSPKSLDKYFSVLDYKTNRVMNFFNPYGNETLNKPFDHLQNCQYSIYTLQLSVYAYMYELETGKKCRDISLLYWDKITESFSRIPVIYLKKEAKILLDLHKYNMELI
jgi:hypothetical protein